MKTQKISMDIGYGDTKVFFNNKLFKFPSAIEQVRQTQVDLKEEKIDVYSYNGVHFRVGEKALLNAIATRGFNFLTKYSPLLVFHALKLAGVDLNKPIELATGLSLLNFHKSNEFIESLNEFSINKENIKLNITLFAQGQGIFLENKSKQDEIVGIIDIGYNTLDFLVFDNDTPRSDYCFANQNGANKIIVDLQKMLTKEFKVNISEQEAKKAFVNKSIKVLGEIVDLEDTIKTMTFSYMDIILDEVYNNCNDILVRADKIILGGGGAYFLDEESIKDKYPNMIMAKTPHEFSNVRGYFLGAFKE
ncbi:PRTRC system protein D [Campylobacter insulaenigrae]|uniref:ParM/StbA family protein n=1 Tax=Campylobacter insulaenigrae TaxID=260714 RepID=UPI000F6D0B0D|nr:ParM/StbA family protein [Campylobacter insulaenigrae]MCR6590509.1 ParM/StbA family protein [Campylobacter insulaenigrae]MCR6592046.1 ParM/StbA family protein [Campylobacter insulaenigrae]VEJ53325.1 PRTRC system protein D [Campylobacter insulaenigrae]